MTFDEYEAASSRTMVSQPLNNHMENAALGLAGEAGEFADHVKKFLFHDRPLEQYEMALELGDILWYVQQAAYSLGYSMDLIASMNVQKLAERYPVGVPFHGRV